MCAQCVGPEASDAALCRDVIHRLCSAPRCDEVSRTLMVGDDCEQTLTARTTCGDETFAFTSPDRARVLSCRLNLLRQGDGVEVHPDCFDTSDFMVTCPDVVTLLKPGAP